METQTWHLSSHVGYVPERTESFLVHHSLDRQTDTKKLLCICMCTYTLTHTHSHAHSLSLYFSFSLCTYSFEMPKGFPSSVPRSHSLLTKPLAFSVQKRTHRWWVLCMTSLKYAGIWIRHKYVLIEPLGQTVARCHVYLDSTLLNLCPLSGSIAAQGSRKIAMNRLHIRIHSIL